MRFRIINLGRVRQSFVHDGVKEYVRRFPRDVEVLLEDLSLPPGDGPLSEKQLADETNVFMQRVPSRSALFLLDERGKTFTSTEFAKLIDSTLQRGMNEIVFGIGGADGWSDTAREKAQQLVSLSRLTFPHQLTRLILTEQLYRAISIIRGGPYHRE